MIGRRPLRQTVATVLLVAGMGVFLLLAGSYLADRIAPQTGALQREIADTQRQLDRVQASVSERDRQIDRLVEQVDLLIGQLQAERAGGGPRAREPSETPRSGPDDDAGDRRPGRADEPGQSRPPPGPEPAPPDEPGPTRPPERPPEPDRGPAGDTLDDVEDLIDQLELP